MMIKRLFQSSKCVFSFLIILSLFFGVQHIAPLYAAVGINETINFQGKLVDNNSLNVANSTYSIVFTLYDASSGGTQLWQETQNVTTTDGIFRVTLGSVTTLSGVDFNSDSLYLGIKVGSDAEMTPRIRFTAVPYAFQAKNATNATNVKLSGITAATATNTIDNTNYAQTWNWSTLSTGIALSSAANSLTSGGLLSLTSSSTAFTGTLANISLSGSNAANTGTLFKVSNTGTLNTGTTAMITNLSAGASFRVNDETGDTDSTPFIIDENGNVGVGDASPDAKFAVGSSSEFQVNSTGNLTKINNVTYSWPAAQAGGSGYVLTNDGAGNLTWQAGVSGSTALSSITAATATNTIDNTNYAQTWNWSTLTTETALTSNANAITSGSILNLSSSSTAFTGTLASINLTGSNAANTGTLFKVSNTGTLNTGTTAMVTNLSAGLSFRVNDQTGDADTTPFVIDASGNVGIGLDNPSSILHTKGANPIFTITNTSQSNNNWQIRHGGTAGNASSLGAAFSIYNSTTSQAGIVIQDDGDVLIGTDYNHGGAGNPSRVFIYGGTNGANVDIMGEPSIGRDQAIVDLQSSDFETSAKSTYLINFGPFGIAANDTLGMPSQDLGALVFANDSAVIGTATAVDLNFSTNELKRMILTSGGNFGIGDLTPASLFTVGDGDDFQINSTGAITAATGITSSGTINFSGLTASKVVFTDGSKNLTSTGTVGVDQGGTGTSSFTAGGILYGNGSSAIGVSTAGTTGQALISGGTGSPTWTIGTLTLAGDFATSGANSLTLTTTGATNITLPTTGTLATLAGTETLTNKTLTDNTTFFQDESDNTKKLQFQLSGITTGNTRTLTIPDASGTICISGGTCAASSVPFSSLTAAGATNTIDNTNYAQTWNWSTLTTETALTSNANAITSGSILNLSSTSTAFTGTLASINLTGSNAANTGTLFKVSNTGTLNTGTTAMITNLSAGTSFRVNDETGDADTTPFIIDASGNVGVGDASPASLFTVGSGDLFQISSAGNVGIFSSPNTNFALNVTPTYTVTSGTTIGGRFAVTATPGSASSASYRAGFFQQDVTGTNAVTGTVMGLNVNAQKSSTGTTDTEYNGLAAAVTNNAGTITTARNTYQIIAGGGTITTGRAIEARIRNTGSGTIGTSAGLYIRTPENSGGGSLTTNYGLYMEDLNVAGTNYAIYTNTGLNRLGDQLSIVGSADRIQLIVRANATQTTNLQEWQNSSGTPIASIDADGDIKPRNVSYAWPSANAAGILTNDGSGNLSWSTLGASNITADSLDFTEFQDTLDLDAALTLNQTTNTWSQTFTGTTTTGFTYNADSLSSGTAVAVSSATSGFSGTLMDVKMQGTSNAGTVLRVSTLGTLNTSTTAMVTNLGTGTSFRVNDETGDTDTTPFIIDASGNVGIGDASPASLLTVGAGDLFQVDTNGDMVKIKNLAYSWPTAHTTNGVLTNNGSGTLTWSTLGASNITADSLDFTEFQDTLDLDAALTLNQTTNTWSQTFTGTTTTGLTYTANSLTSGKAQFITSSATAFTGTLVDISLTGSSVSNTGTLFKVSNTGTSNTGTSAMITNLSAGTSFQVNDETGDGDTTPFVIDASGNIGVGTASPGSKFELSDAATTTTSTFNNTNASGRSIISAKNTSAGSSLDIRAYGGSYSETLFGNAMASDVALIGSPGTGNAMVIGNFSNGDMILGTNNAERLRIEAGGDVGIGTTNPTSSQTRSLHISDSTSAALRVSRTSATAADVELGVDSSSLSYVGTTTTTGFSIKSANTEAIRITTGQLVGIGTSTLSDRLHVFGDIRVGTTGTNGCLKRFDGTALTGTCSSDIRLKKDLQSFSSAQGSILNRLKQLNPTYYYWRADEHPEFGFGREKVLGLIAQDVEAIFPELVEQNGQGGFKAIRYELLPFYMLQGMREQQTLIDQNGDSITSVNSQVSSLATNVDALSTVSTSQSTTLQTLQTEINEIRTGLTSLTIAFNALVGRVNAVETTIANHTSQLASILSRLDYIKPTSGTGKLDQMDERIAFLEEAILASGSAQATSSGSVAGASTSANLSSTDQTATLAALMVTGESNLHDVSIMGRFNIGILSADGINGNIDALGTALQLQSTASGPVQIMANKIEMTQAGNVVVKEGDIEVQQGVIKANNKVRDAATISAGQTTITITGMNWASVPVTITANTSYDSYVWITNITTDGFTIHVKNAPSATEKIYWQGLW